MAKINLFLFLFCALFGEPIADKLLICGICKDVEAAIPNSIRSAEDLGSRFQDYRVIIYENNSKDKTKEMMSEWTQKNPKVTFISQHIKNSQFKRESPMKVKNRTEVIARARNIVLDRAMAKEFDEYKYIVWADLDFLEPWDVDEIVNIILHPEREWDAVFAYGAYDLFALRSEDLPIGFELLGNLYWDHLDALEKQYVLNEKSPWKKVYSAFGGMGVYKREALKGCRYSGIVTRDMETVVAASLKKAREKKDVCLLQDYENLLKKSKIVELKEEIFKNKKKFADPLGVKLLNRFGIGQVVWFSCTKNNTLPWTCEHIPLHASMILKGHDRLFVDPKLRSNHPKR